MSRRTGRILAGIAVVAVLVGLGIFIYNLGIHNGVAQAGAGRELPGGYFGLRGGLGFGMPMGSLFGWGLGLLFPLLMIGLIVWLLVAAFSPGDRRSQPPADPAAWDPAWRSRFAEVHRQYHEEEARRASATSPVAGQGTVPGTAPGAPGAGAQGAGAQGAQPPTQV